MWSVMLCLVGTTMALDAATVMRQQLNPYVLYDFMDADQNGFATTTAADQANHPVISFGNLTLGPRATWLVGKPGVSLQHETSSGVSAAMGSTNNFLTSWTSYFSSFTVELWIQVAVPFSLSSKGSLFSLSRAITGAAFGGGSGCNVTEPLLDFQLSGCPASFSFRTAVNTTNGVGCAYNSFPLNPLSSLFAVPYFFTTSVPTPSSWSYWVYDGSALNASDTLGATFSKPLKWVDTSAKLYFSNSNNIGNLDFSLLSFAMYPSLSPSQIDGLVAKGLPNPKPIIPNLRRSVQETTGGTIQFCPNVIGTPRDSDCLDYTTNATASGHALTLTPSANLLVIIMSLPTKGNLSQGGVAITTAPFTLNSNNTVMYTPPPDATSWYAQWNSAPIYYIFKSDYTWFTYQVQDPSGVNSSIGNVTLEVYPRHTPPVSNNIGAAQSTIYAGRGIIQTNPANSISLLPIIKEFLPPDSMNPVCTASMVGANYVMCLNGKDHPDPAATFITIKSVPSVGQLWYVDNASAFVPVVVGTNISADQESCAPTPGTVNGVCAWKVWYNVSSTLFNSSNATLGQVTFTYTTTTTLDVQKYMNNTRYIVDSAGSVQSVNFSPQTVSNVATVYVDIKNGFYAANGQSSVFQHNYSTIMPQEIDLEAADVTIPNAVITYVIKSLPVKGGLFVPGKPLVPLTAADLALIVTLPNSTVLYQPSLPNQPYGFMAGQNYESFTFYAISGGKSSNVALQVINVIDTNDPVNIFWAPTAPVLAYKRVGTPQKWSDLAGNELYVNFTDPDLPQPNEPYYDVIVDSPAKDFYIFLSDSIFAELQVEKAQGRGQRIGGSTAGAGSSTWQFIVPRDLAQRALMSIRLRPDDNVKSTVLTITVKDCIFVTGQTDPKFSGANWQSSTTQASVTLSGTTSDGSTPYQGVADPTVTGVIYGVIAFIGVVFLICGFFIVRWCCRKRGSGGGSTGSAKTGSTYAKGKGKGKKAKSAYLHEVEL